LDTKFSALYRSILKLGLYGDGSAESRRVYLVDRDGRAIYHYSPGRVGQDLSEQPAVQTLLRGETNTLRTQDLDGHEIIASSALLPGIGWGLILEENWAVLTQASQDYRRTLVILLGLGVLLPVAAVALGARRVVSPIVQLTEAARAVTAGDLNQTIVADTDDELEILADQFNQMSRQLQASYASLEQRVADRTRELATLNAVAAAVSRSLDLEEVLYDALDKTMEAVGMEAGAAFRLGDDADTLTLMAYRGLSDHFVRQASRLPLQVSLAGQASSAGAPTVRLVPQYPDGALKALLQDEGLQTIISVPLITKGKLLGAINLASRHHRIASAEEIGLLAAVGQQTALAVENARLYEQAEQHAVAAERNRLARELHDAVTQTLFSSSLIADVLPRLWQRDPEQAQQRLAELRELTRGALAEMRTLLLELRPAALDEADLNDLLKQLAESVTGRARVPVSVEASDSCPAPTEVKVALYRISQEALNNIVKHAGASCVNLRLVCTSDTILLQVQDDGRGFNPGNVPSNHLGLGIMQERAAAIGARLEIESEVGLGTEIRVLWKAPSTEAQR
jgi:nitrate/nitrite-specific signal transduction histidine kinase